MLDSKITTPLSIVLPMLPISCSRSSILSSLVACKYNLIDYLRSFRINDAMEPIQQQLAKDENDSMPEYAKQTITRKMKDHELQRIADKTT